MQQNTTKDFFLNLGSTITLYILVGSLLNLLFTVINRAYPKIINGYNYASSSSISWPVAILIILTPIFLSLMWVIGKDFALNPEKRISGVHKFVTYLTLFLAGALLAGDLVMVVYYFLDGQDLSAAFLLKALAVLVLAGSIFMYYIGDVKGTLTQQKRMYWRYFAIALVIGSIVLGFSVLGSPRTQRLYKYDEAKVTDLQNINSQIQYYFQTKNSLPNTLTEVSAFLNYELPKDGETGNAYEYVLVGQSVKAYQLCAVFNKASAENLSTARYPYGETSWQHEEGRDCFDLSIPLNMYPAKNL